MNLLALVQAAADEMGIKSPSQVVGSTDQQIKQLKAIAGMVGGELITDFHWQRADKLHTFDVETDSQDGTLTSGSASVTGLTDTSDFAADTWQVSGNGIPTETTISSVDSATAITLSQNATSDGAETLTFTKTIYDLPSDWNYQINRTEWDRTNNWELIGPETPQGWAYLKGGIVSTGPRIRFRILGNKFQIFPLQVSASRVAFEYMSDNWIIATGGTDPTKSAFTVDTDETIFRDRVMIAGIKYHFFDIKGFDTTTLSKAYSRAVDKAKAQDHAAPTLSLSPRPANILITTDNVPDGNIYGQ